MSPALSEPFEMRFLGGFRPVGLVAVDGPAV
jgi:hypothetical protein